MPVSPTAINVPLLERVFLVSTEGARPLLSEPVFVLSINAL